MEINKSKTIEVNWLGNCPTCDREEHMVSTFVGNKDYLYEDDTVKCWCGQTGVIEANDEGHAWCNWDEKAATEWDNFNLYYRQKFPEYWDLLPKANHQACLHHEELFNSWVTAKSQAVPEGFVLVPKVLTHDVGVKISDNPEFFEVYQNILLESETSEDAAVILIQTAHKAMIEAQEQSHESE